MLSDIPHDDKWTPVSKPEDRQAQGKTHTFTDFPHSAVDSEDDDHDEKTEVSSNKQKRATFLSVIIMTRSCDRPCHVSRSSGLAKTILQGTVKGGRRQGGQRKRWEDNIREWTGLGFSKSQRAVKNREHREKTGFKIICGALTTLAVEGLMMMMMMMMM